MKVMKGVVLWSALVLFALPVGKVQAGAFADAAAALEAEVAALQATITAQQATIADLQNQVVALSPLQALAPYVTVSTEELNGLSGPHVIFNGANLHVQSGSGLTNGPVNGLGNLVIGYNEIPNDGLLLPGERGGSHNLIMGRAHRYPSNDSILHGWGSTANEHAVAILGGDGTVVNRSYSVAVGGKDNVINERGVTIGGFSNVINGFRSVVVGGTNNIAAGEGSTVTGGQSNSASGAYSSVSGGVGVEAVNDNGWAAGSLSE